MDLKNTSVTRSISGYTRDTIDYTQRAIEFIKEVKGPELIKPEFILATRPFSITNFNCVKELLNDTVSYSKEELKFIAEQNYPSISSWTIELFPNTKLINSDTIEMIFKDRTKGWQYFYKEIGQSFNRFSVPIFIRDYSFCLFYSDNSCGRCGSGKLTLYKKDNNRWKEVKSYCQWIS